MRSRSVCGSRVAVDGLSLVLDPIGRVISDGEDCGRER